MKRYCSMLIFLMLLSVPVFSQAQSKYIDSKPNIILIMADDLGRSELGSYGQQVIRTPNLDRMAKEGMRFTDFYAGSTVCAPSRNALMTGRHTGNTFVRGNFHTGNWPADLTLPDSAKTIAEYMKEAGYRTSIMGKWGLGNKPNEQGFDYSLAYLDQIDAHSYYPPHLWENQQKLSLKGNHNGGHGTYSHNVFVNKTLEYIKDSDSEEPFFLYLPYTLPHGAFEIPDDAPYSNEAWPQEKKNIAAMITLLDQDIGRILQLLEDKGIAKNTVVFFTSDNGPTSAGNRYFDSNGPLRGIKRDLYEGGIRVPLIAWWPGTIQDGQTSHHVAAAWDFLPTLAELAGVEVQPDIDGLSFVAELLGEEQSKHEFLYWEYYHYNWSWGRDDYDGQPQNWLQSRAIRYGKWKAVKNNIYRNTDETLELYNLSTDIGENYNVADEHPEVVKNFQNYFSKCCSVSPYFPRQQSTGKLHIINTTTPQELKDFFRYTDDRDPLVSSHRGGARAGFPENALVTFENTLRHTRSLMEVDPRYSKDSVIVLFHDQTLERTSTGQGRVSDYTYEDLQEFKLKDTEGRVTEHRIPTLGEALDWAGGKTILFLDNKDVSVEARVRAIQRHQAEAHAVVMAYNFKDAKQVYKLDPDIMMQVFIPDEEAVARFDQTGIPWENVIAFVTHKPIDDSYTDLLHLINKKGAMTVIGTSRTLDRAYASGKIDSLELAAGYRKVIRDGADIIEADLGIEAGKAVEEL